MRHPGSEIGQIAGQQIVGIGRTALPAAAELQILIGHQKHPTTRHLRLVLADTLDHFLRGNLAFIQRLEPDDHEGIVDAALPANEASHAFHGRIGQHCLAVSLHLRLHDLERQAVVAANEAGQLAGVLLREEGFRNLDIQKDVETDGRQQGKQRDPMMPQRPA